MQIDTLMQAGKRLRNKAKTYRRPIGLASLLLFVGGIVWALDRIAIDWSDVDLTWLALVLLVLVPANLLVAAINLQLLARAVDQRIDGRTAIMVTAYGRVAELLPIPGAAIMRGAALMQAGASAADSARILAWSSVLTLGMAGLVAALPITVRLPLLAGALALGSAVLCAVSLRWLAGRLTGGQLAGMIGVRLGILATTVLRFWACFAALGYTASFFNTAVFVIGGTLTTLIGIAPGGLGISEGISAAIALTVGIPAALAFLTAALNRLLGLAGSGLVALVCLLSGMRQEQENHG